ncbi:MAG: YchJ family metal-binding protein [Pseudomonadota bacterium]
MSSTNSDSQQRGCPCGSTFALAACCLPFIAELAPAPTAEALMRSRYTAFTMNHVPYLLASWHPDTRPAGLTPAPGTQWLGLKIKRTHNGQAGDRHGEVEFVARSKLNGRARRLHETSQFVFNDGRWFYVNGVRHN